VLGERRAFGMDLSRVVDDHTRKDLNSTSSSKSTSETSSRSNSVEGLRIVDNEFHSSLNQSSSNFASSLNQTSLPYSNHNNSLNGQSTLSNSTAAYNVNQDFLIRMAMQNNTGNTIVSNGNMFHNNKLYNDNLVAVAAAVVNVNSHSLYQSALTNTSSNNSISAHHLAALNSPHNSAFQNLQQNAHSSHQPQLKVNNSSNSTITNQMNGHSAPNSGTADQLLSTMSNGTNQSLLAVTNGLMNGNSNTLNTLSTSNLSNNGSTNSPSSSSNGSLGNNSQITLNEQLLNGTNSIINHNLILGQNPFTTSTLIDSSTSNLLSSIKKRKRSPQPIPSDLKDDAYWDRRRRNNESAKRSREVRRIKEQSMHYRLAFLEKRNLQLSTELEMAKQEVKKMHDIIYCQRYSQNNQQDKHSL